MSEPTPAGGASSQNDAAALDKNTAPAKTAPKRDPRLVERDELLARMDAQVDEQRARENEEFLRSSDADPAAWLLHQRMTAEARGAEAPVVETAAEIEEETPAAPPVAAPAAVPAQRVSTKGEDPLGDYVVRKDGKPMFKTLVDGQERLIPLDAARAQLQKHLAADIRLQQAAEQRKQLDARAAELQATEARLKARPQPTATAPVDDKALDAEAVEIVRSLVSEPEDKAAARLAKTLRSIRQAPGPQVDVDAVAERAAEVAEQRLVVRQQNEAMRSGFETFTSTYRDIAGDPELFAIADRKTEAIAAEHPDWAPEQVMLEAGKQTREWLKGKGAPIAAAPVTSSNRQQRKEGLRPMPTPRTATPVTVKDEDGGNSPSNYVAELRKARGMG